MKLQLFALPLYPKDVEIAKTFWVDQIGMELINTKTTGDGNTVYCVKFPDMSFHFELYAYDIVEEMVRDNKPSLMFSTDDIDATYALYKERGVQLLDGVMEHPEVGRYIVFLDSEGNGYAMCEVAK